MIDWYMYNEIQKLKSMGFSKSRTAHKLQINFRTVSRYWDMTPADYAAAFKDRSRNSIRIYPAHRVMTGSMKNSRLPHRSRNAPCAVTSPGCGNNTQFRAKVPPAEQAQVDMGSNTLTRQNGGKIKVYCFAMVLSHSRYKYAFWQDHPFTTAEFVAAHQKAFSFFGGRPGQLVYDQDRVMTVSENHGDILFTEGFRIYADALHFQIYLCRGADPETKGKVEAVVKYLKYNFAKNRAFVDIHQLNSQCLEWLFRTGNGKEHQTTKKVPVQMFALEKQHLIPVPAFETAVPESIVT